MERPGLKNPELNKVIFDKLRVVSPKEWIYEDWGKSCRKCSYTTQIEQFTFIVKLDWLGDGSHEYVPQIVVNERNNSTNPILYLRDTPGSQDIAELLKDIKAQKDNWEKQAQSRLESLSSD